MFKKVIVMLKTKKGGGLEMMLRDIRSELLKVYTRIEKNIKNRPKSVFYLLALFGEDVPKML